MKFSGKLTKKTELSFFGDKQTAKISLSFSNKNERGYEEGITIDFIGNLSEVGMSGVVGELYTVSFTSSTREYNGKMYNSLKGIALDIALDSKMLQKEIERKNMGDDLPF